MLILFGKSPLSAFRLQQLVTQLQAACPEVRGCVAQTVYLLQVDGDLPSKQLQKMMALLPCEVKPKNLVLDPENYLVLPRFGTISPWSSKASEIMQHCGAENVLRIEHGILYEVQAAQPLTEAEQQQVTALLHDRMVETVITDVAELEQLFTAQSPQSLTSIDVMQQGKAALTQANQSMGLALNEQEVDFLHTQFSVLKRNPTDIELMMFAQANSEHCRHKIFNASWQVDGQAQEQSLFSMIRNTYQTTPDHILSAYSDNAAVISGWQAERLWVNSQDQTYHYQDEPVAILIKVETHNHPTAIAPFSGAATGSGGEIRDEGATGRGGQPKMGLAGFSVSHLRIPNYTQPWEAAGIGKPDNIASPLQIMIDGPIGGASFNNEFGRPNLCGYFRTFEYAPPDSATHWRGYHKPIMIAGGLGNVRESLALKQTIPAEALVIVLGGPAMKIGLGGSAASSKASGHGDAELDFASVQRANPEMQRRCQEVINHCCALGDANPLISIHDVGAGGLSNAIPELIHDSERGGAFHLRSIPNAEPGMSPLAIWCNEAQERYVLALLPKHQALFQRIAQRERCPFAVVGTVRAEQHLSVDDDHFDNHPIDIPMPLLFGKMPRMQREAEHRVAPRQALNFDHISLEEAAERVLRFPAVASKQFLITIGDRSVGGLVARDQMVGPWQVPVADVAVTATGFKTHQGEAMAMGERSPVALLNAAASARMAVGEALTNLAAAPIVDLKQVKLSANWMAACDYPGADAELYDAVQAVGMTFCPALGLTIPVGKDSLSMRTVWQEQDQQKSVASPISLVVSAFSPVTDVRETLTPQLRTDCGETDLWLIDLAAGRQRLGGSALAQVTNQLGEQAADVDDPEMLKRFMAALHNLRQQKDNLLAYHDRSDGGLFACICEMAFAGRTGVRIDLSGLGDDILAALFNEELGVVIQTFCGNYQDFQNICIRYQLVGHRIGTLTRDSDQVTFVHRGKTVLSQSRQHWQQVWSETSYLIQRLRDNPTCAEQEFSQLQQDDPGLSLKTYVTFSSRPSHYTTKPRVAILREQGVNGQMEMAAAFDRAGFTAVDVHMSDIISGHVSLKGFVGLAACGGFSYGDVLGAGRGWAGTILHHSRTYHEFRHFWERDDTFTLGVCNGCQMLAQLHELIPGAKHWPNFVRNTSEQFEARLSMVTIPASPSIFFTEMAGSRLPVVVSHGEGRVEWRKTSDQAYAQKHQLIALQYIDNHSTVTESYPQNPNGSSAGITALTTTDGRATIMMPHPERVFRTSQLSWHPPDWEAEESPWLQLFINARRFVG